NQLDDPPQLATLGLWHETPEIMHRAAISVDVAKVRDVVTIVADGRGVERQQPQGSHPELLQVIKLLGQSDKIPDAVVVAVGERFDVKLIHDRVFEPKLVGFELRIEPFELGIDLDIGGSDVHGTIIQDSGK